MIEERKKLFAEALRDLETATDHKRFPQAEQMQTASKRDILTAYSNLKDDRDKAWGLVGHAVKNITLAFALEDRRKEREAKHND